MPAPVVPAFSGPLPLKTDLANYEANSQRFMNEFPSVIEGMNAMGAHMNENMPTVEQLNSAVDSASGSANTATTKAGEAAASANTSTTKANEAAASAAAAATFNPALYVPRAGGISMTGGLTLPDLETTGSLRLPRWTTSGRPALPSAGWTGFNTDLGCNETFNGSSWVQDGWQYGSPVVPSGISVLVTSGIPSWANEVAIHLAGVSMSTTSPFILRANSDAASYKASSLVMTTGNIVTGSADSTGFKIDSGNANNEVSGTIKLLRVSGNTWACSYLLGNNTAALFGGGGVKTFSEPLSTVAFVRLVAGGEFDGGTFTPAWRQ